MSSVSSGNRSSQDQHQHNMMDNMSVYSSESTVVVSNNSRRAIQKLFGSNLGSFSKSQKITKMDGSNERPTDWQRHLAASLRTISDNLRAISDDFERMPNPTDAQRQAVINEWNQELARLEPVVAMMAATNPVQQEQLPVGQQDRHSASQHQSLIAGRLQDERHGAVTGLESTEPPASLSGISVNVNPSSVDSVSTITDNNNCAMARALLRPRNVDNNAAANQSEAGPDAPMTVLPSASNGNNGMPESNLLSDPVGTVSISTESPVESIGQPFGSRGSDDDVASHGGGQAPPS